MRLVLISKRALRAHVIQQSLLEKFWYSGGSPQINKCNVCETHPTTQQPEPNFSLLVTLTVFVAGATNQPDIQTQTGS